MTLKEKLNLWVKITGLDPSEEKTSFSINLSGKLSDYDIKLILVSISRNLSKKRPFP